MTTKLFTYGLLQVPRIQQQLFKRNIEQTTGILFGYKISNTLVNGLYKTIEKTNPEFFIEGTILFLNDEDIAKCDKFEGVEAGLYKRIDVEGEMQAYIADNRAYRELEAEEIE
jgi:hypothetical protein